MKRVDNKVAIVTGVSKGIGAGIKKPWVPEGAAVVVNYARVREGAERVVREITDKGGKAIAVQGDVGQRADAQRLVAEARWGSGMPGQPFHYTGTDFLEERDGRVSRLYTFIDQQLLLS